jgi:hypothetical protein
MLNAWGKYIVLSTSGTTEGLKAKQYEQLTPYNIWSSEYIKHLAIDQLERLKLK